MLMRENNSISQNRKELAKRWNVIQSNVWTKKIQINIHTWMVWSQSDIVC